MRGGDQSEKGRGKFVATTKSQSALKRKLALVARMDKLREQIGPIGVRTSELVKDGRRR